MVGYPRRAKTEGWEEAQGVYPMDAIDDINGTELTPASARKRLTWIRCVNSS